MTKNILCFGDSNTYGYVPDSGERFSKDVRWTSVLGAMLGDNYKVFEAGCNNRACFVEHIDGDKFIGTKFIHKYKPYNIDIIITSLGVNDLQKNYKPDIQELEQGFERYINAIRKDFGSKIIILAPPIVKTVVLKTWFSELFDETSVETSRLLPNLWKKVAEKTGVYYLNLNEKIEVSNIDGLHFDKNAHRTIAEELAQFITSTEQDS